MASEFARMFKQAFARRIAYMVVSAIIAGVLYLCGTATAQAHDNPCKNSVDRTCDQGVAKEQAQLLANSTTHCQQLWSDVMPDVKAVITTVTQTGPDGTGAGQYSPVIQCRRISNNASLSGRGTADIYYYKGTCAERNASLGGPNRASRDTTSTSDDCIAGCKYVVDGQVTTNTIAANLAGQGSVQTGQNFTAQWHYNGEVCVLDPPKERQEEKPKELCTPASAGQTYCQLPNGNQCHTASTGRTICWTPGETGTKTDGTVSQNKAPGNQPPANIEGMTHQSTTNITKTSSSSSSTTTITNYTTNNGSPAGTSNQGTPSGSSGGPSNGTGNGSGGSSPGGSGSGDDDNESSGGGNCEAAPTSSGDPILGNILVQTWSTRCNTEKGELDGDGTCSDQGTVVGFACSGDPVGCKQALEAKEANCKTWAKDKNANGQPDWTEDGDIGSIPGEGDDDERPRFGINWGTSMLDTTDIFGGGGCQNFTLEIMGTSVSTNEFPHWCNFLAIARALILIFAAYMSVRILLGGN